jgi:hypothetical protein
MIRRGDASPMTVGFVAADVPAPTRDSCGGFGGGLPTLLLATAKGTTNAKLGEWRSFHCSRPPGEAAILKFLSRLSRGISDEPGDKCDPLERQPHDLSKMPVHRDRPSASCDRASRAARSSPMHGVRAHLER